MLIFFEKISVDYWLGGGLLRCLEEKKYKDINKKWKNHDIDFHVKMFNRPTIICNLDILASKGYTCVYNNYRKLAFCNKAGRRVEFPFLYPSKTDPRLVFFLGHGKKGAIHMKSEDIRKRTYHHDIPAEFFGNDEVAINGFKLRVPKSEYASFLYHFKN